MNSDIEVIYNLYFKKIYKFFYFKTLSKTIAEDLTSETFLRLIIKNKSLKIESYKNFIYGIARNVFLEFLKNKYRNLTEEITDSIESLSPDNMSDFVENFSDESISLEDKLKKYITYLPNQQKLVINKRLIEKKSREEISIEMGITLHNVKIIQNRAINKLKKLIQQL